ncbi:CoA transferase [Dactylosporangium sp. McL0621]|uniref:CoA transferase n=1 Tax=Dactylosporangium sp. McL0621 TaxID=3415678 RepID=UPI003CF180D1
MDTAPLAVDECALAAVSACLEAAADLAEARGGRRPEVTLDPAHVAAAVRSEALLRDPAGRGIEGFAPLSRLWRAADGWVRTHANYPWHRAALIRALGDDIERAIAERPALEVERLVYESGGLAVAARTTEQWRAERAVAESGRLADAGRTTEQASARRALSVTGVGAAAYVNEQVRGGRGGGDDGPLIGIWPTGGRREPRAAPRVLDLTRVIAGPVGTRMLGALGADVLRVDDPNRPELPLHAVDGVIGKASTLLDAATPGGREALHRLAEQADVIVTGYRPGAMRRLGLDPDQIAERYPGTVVATLSAWGTEAEWGNRRGFDSLVQVATGIGWRCSPDGERPGALPCQLLDHATGYLLAAGVLRALATGEGAHVSVSLARTARWLLDQPEGQPEGRAAGRAEQPVEPDAYRVGLGNGWTSIAPPGRLDGAPLAWPRLPPAYGQAPPVFTAR